MNPGTEMVGTKKRVRPVVTEENKREAEALLTLWKRRKDKLSQAEFGKKWEIGKQGTVSQYLNGVAPLSLRAAICFSKGLNCKVEEFAPRLVSGIASVMNEVEGTGVETAQERLPIRLATGVKGNYRQNVMPFLEQKKGRAKQQACADLKALLGMVPTDGTTKGLAKGPIHFVAVNGQSTTNFCTYVPFCDAAHKSTGMRFQVDEFVLVDARTEFNETSVQREEWIFLVDKDSNARLFQVKAQYDRCFVVVKSGRENAQPEIFNMDEALLWGRAVHPLPATTVLGKDKSCQDES